MLYSIGERKETEMMNVTDKAAALIGEALDTQRQNDSDVFRFSRVDQDFGLNIDEEHEGDQVVLAGDRKVLVIESEISQELDGTTIDAVDTPEGERLTLLPFPSAESPA